MPTKQKPSVSNEDLFYLLQKLYDRFDGFEKAKERDHAEFRKTDQKLLDMVSGLVISVGKIVGELVFLNHHSSEHFDKNEQQDKRLDRIETQLGMPKLAF